MFKFNNKDTRTAPMACIYIGYKQESLQKEIKMTNIDFVILNTHVTYIFKIYQKHQFFCGKTKKCKIALFFPAIYPCLQDVPF